VAELRNPAFKFLFLGDRLIHSAMVSETTKKRRFKQESKSLAVKPKIFHPFRAIGYITNDVPAAFDARGQDFFMTTCVGKNFQIYNVS
jgi:U3 small nucleolar RNA-associated protein 21